MLVNLKADPRIML